MNIRNINDKYVFTFKLVFQNILDSKRYINLVRWIYKINIKWIMEHLLNVDTVLSILEYI